MATIQRLTDSCLVLTTDSGATLFDPGFHTYQSGMFDLSELGDVTRVMVTHEHGDHVNPDFVRWLIDRKADLEVYSNEAVRDLLAGHDIEVHVEMPDDVAVEDVRHGRLPNGTAPPNRAFTVEGLFTHPGDSREPTTSGRVLALPLMAPWDSATGAVEFCRRVRPERVVPIHDFYMSESGRAWLRGTVKSALSDDGIEVADVDWGDSLTV